MFNEVEADGKGTSLEDIEDSNSGRLGSDDMQLGVSLFITDKLVTQKDKQKKTTALATKVAHQEQYKSVGFTLWGKHQNS